MAKDLAKILEYTHIDSGAMYRAVTYHILECGIEPTNHRAIEEQLIHINIRFDRREGNNRTILNDNDVEDQIRTMVVSKSVSEVSTIPKVRSFLVDQQRKLARGGGVIMDGRDIGTVVFPNADVKLFVTASVDIRANRRHAELAGKGIELNLKEVKENLETRDHIDSTREDSPLRQADDAYLLDTSDKDRGEMVVSAIQTIHQHINKTS